MTAFQEYVFTQGFFLDEKRVDKICEILIKRIASIDPSISLEYEVERAGGYSYVTKNIQEIFNEENTKFNRIKRLTIRIDRHWQYKFYGEVTFQDDWFRLTNLEVKGEDRNLVNETFLELKQYLSNKVNIFKGLSKWIEPIGWITIFLIFISIIVIKDVTTVAEKPYISPNELNALLQSNNVNEKLNFIINTLAKNSDYFTKVPLSSTDFLLIIFIISLMSWLAYPAFNKVLKFIQYLFPRCVFMLGEGKEEYESIKNLREKIFWGIIAGFLVSLLAGLPYFLLTK